MVGEATASDAGFLGRLEQEARLAGSLNHPNIVAVHDIGVHEGAPLRRHRAPPGRDAPRPRSTAVRCRSPRHWSGRSADRPRPRRRQRPRHRPPGPQARERLPHPHRAGEAPRLRHRQATTPVTASRGLFDPPSAPAGRPPGPVGCWGRRGTCRRSRSGASRSTPRSDVFALGAILYELLSGQRAFKGGSVVESGYSILHDEPPPLPPSAPPTWPRWSQRCLAKDTEQRFQSARDVAFSLAGDARQPDGHPGAPPATLEGSGRRAPAPCRAAARRRVAPRAGDLCAGACLPRRSPWLLRPSGSSPSSGVRSAAARFAPDGRTVHFSAAWEEAHPRSTPPRSTPSESRSLGLGSLATAGGRLIRRARGLTPVRASSISSMRERNPGPRATDGGTPRELATNIEYADWAPDGTKLAVASVDETGSRLEFPDRPGGVHDPPAR